MKNYIDNNNNNSSNEFKKINLTFPSNLDVKTNNFMNI